MVTKRKKIQTSEREGEVCFFLNKEFYTLKEMREALNDFKFVCEGKIEETPGKMFKIVLKSKDSSKLNMLEHEFCNYSLGLMKNNMCI